MTGNTDLREANGCIVVIGNVNPRICQPEWLSKYEIIGPIEAELTRKNGIEVIHPQLTVLHLASLRVDVQLDRFTVIAREAPLGSLFVAFLLGVAVARRRSSRADFRRP